MGKYVTMGKERNVMMAREFLMVVKDNDFGSRSCDDEDVVMTREVMTMKKVMMVEVVIKV